MSNQTAPDPGTALLALLAYQNLRVAESLLPHDGGVTDFADRLTVARISAGVLTRFTQACDAIPGGQNAAHAAMEPIISPVDEFWSMTRPRVRVEQRLRVMAVASLELELVQRAQDNVPDIAWEAMEPSAALWRAIDHGSQSTIQAIVDHTRSADEMSLYARRLLGEAAVMGQRVLMRQEPLRRALTGVLDEDFSASTERLDEVLAGVATRLGQLGLSV